MNELATPRWSFDNDGPERLRRVPRADLGALRPTAEELNVSVRTVQRRMKHYGMELRSYTRRA